MAIIHKFDFNEISGNARDSVAHYRTFNGSNQTCVGSRAGADSSWMTGSITMHTLLKRDVAGSSDYIINYSDFGETLQGNDLGSVLISSGGDLGVIWEYGAGQNEAETVTGCPVGSTFLFSWCRTTDAAASSSIQFYLNGAPLGSERTDLFNPEVAAPETHFWTIGSLRGTSAYFDGNIYFASVHDTAWTDQQVADFYSASYDGSTWFVPNVEDYSDDIKHLWVGDQLNTTDAMYDRVQDFGISGAENLAAVNSPGVDPNSAVLSADTSIEASATEPTTSSP